MQNKKAAPYGAAFLPLKYLKKEKRRDSPRSVVLYESQEGVIGDIKEI